MGKCSPDNPEVVPVELPRLKLVLGVLEHDLDELVQVAGPGVQDGAEDELGRVLGCSPSPHKKYSMRATISHLPAMAEPTISVEANGSTAEYGVERVAVLVGGALLRRLYPVVELLAEVLASLARRPLLPHPLIANHLSQLHMMFHGCLPVLFSLDFSAMFRIQNLDFYLVFYGRTYVFFFGRNISEFF